ncbi:MAG: PIN domain-containing protein [Deltaproteobacteria bacterium]|nr:PIN domain-containing protein [Deltaproteobacteria bacterium]
MSGDRYVLDTSALLTLIEDEPGADRVQQILAEEEVLIPWVVLLEAVYISRQERGEAEAERRYALLKQLRAVILWEVDEPTLLTAARFKADYRVSLADAMIAAFAARQSAVLLHKDPEYEPLSSTVRQDLLPYKA